MWLNQDRNTVIKAFIIAFGATVFFYSSGAYAVGVPDLSVMLTNFATAVPNLMRLVTAVSYVMGMFFVVAAIMGMKHFGEMRTMMSQEHGVTGPVVEFLVGAALLYLPSTIRTSLSTFWVSTNPYAYLTVAPDQYTTFTNACYSIVQLVGVIAFIRGLLILKKVGGGKSQETFGKAMAHLGGGILCINLYGAIQMLQATVGWTS
ncbi:MAG TPA: hypothetical protein VLH77_05585 [Gammaproteobacteria bacterium]|nr:hypothetical protein [Gammaproteobacteria bacterium]